MSIVLQTEGISFVSYADMMLNNNNNNNAFSHIFSL